MEPVDNGRVNNSLQRFGNAITGLVLGGLGLALIGVIMLLSNSGYSDDAWLLYLGGLFAYTGSGLIGLGIFGAFLKITAKAIVEGLGGSIREENSSQPGFSTGADTFQPLPSSQDLSKNLTKSQREKWIQAGQPDLKGWFESGKFSFSNWLKDQA